MASQSRTGFASFFSTLILSLSLFTVIVQAVPVRLPVGAAVKAAEHVAAHHETARPHAGLGPSHIGTLANLHKTIPVNTFHVPAHSISFAVSTPHHSVALQEHSSGSTIHAPSAHTIRSVGSAVLHDLPKIIRREYVDFEDYNLY